MTKYMLLYSGGMGPDDMSEEDRGKEMAAWMAWFGKLGEAVVDGGNPLAASKGIDSDGTVSDSPALAGASLERGLRPRRRHRVGARLPRPHSSRT